VEALCRAAYGERSDERVNSRPFAVMAASLIALNNPISRSPDRDLAAFGQVEHQFGIDRRPPRMAV
jgi:hypothetical protein